MIGLTAEVPDPRNRTPKSIFLSEEQVEIHQVAGIIFDHDITIGAGAEEPVPIDADRVFASVEVGFRVVEHSALPLALANQIVLGGRRLDLGALDQRGGALVAITLDDGSSIFKRVGPAFPGNLSHLRQFESIGGLGSSQVIAVGKEEPGFHRIQSARLIIGVLYHG
ncbi:hypothetical protein NKH60_30830 [Mesorhizobium sp. M1006]|uniref:hypothetical protein n=1 Tax=Mesorhizobium sp. M1006 TaxID=2957048 RepID=UPI00333DDCDB